MPPIIGNRAKGLSGSGSLIGGVSGLSPLGSGGATPFEFENALRFDGVNDTVDITATRITGDGTLSFWFKRNNLTQEAFFGSNSNPNGNYVGYLDGSTTLRFLNNSFNDFTLPAISTGIWYNITIVTEASVGMRVYLNGVESSTGLQGYLSYNIGFIGAYRGNLFFFDGDFDQMTFWSGVYATPSQVVDLYNSGNGNFSASVIPNPTRLYRFNSTTGAVAVDDGSSPQDGTLLNFTGAYWVPHV